ncbi:riboflavin biosynthesis protein RibF [Thermacetogenium phaeum DSM 12270]|uniref:Riboflavin biosynthesis protein n=1 Tax=Thermacetogenium phaeum (strain ATCC BAA-254 / DSM 26808 / PB) TaxID=1089553 RepID=K4LH24_THEPS|nr:bifunctional riboflavin kinase/FAD synthetase [Thermacetogenium phaeum]AFV11357.1 riboflavin biosynthesis protein RibF [Thermacetogenium phaeum DSM 12270]
MKVLQELDQTFSDQKLILALGNFDGVHRGHKLLLEEMCRFASRLEAVPAALLFYPHPQQVLNPEKAPGLIIDNEKKLELMEALGIEAVIMLPFDRQMAALSPQQFIEEILLAKLKVTGVFVGFNYRFGCGATGTPELLLDYGKRLNFYVRVMPPVILNGTPVSSTSVRSALLEGDISEAKSLLGYWPVIRGRVVPGDGRGKKLGYPTANIQVPEQMLVPRSGVYACQALLEGDFYPAVLNIGKHPTFGCSRNPLIEVHLLNFRGNIYGAKMEIRLFQRLRSEKKFASKQDLINQIRKDVESAVRILEKIEAFSVC